MAILHAGARKTLPVLYCSMSACNGCSLNPVVIKVCHSAMLTQGFICQTCTFTLARLAHTMLVSLLDSCYSVTSYCCMLTLTFICSSALNAFAFFPCSWVCDSCASFGSLLVFLLLWCNVRFFLFFLSFFLFSFACMDCRVLCIFIRRCVKIWSTLSCYLVHYVYSFSFSLSLSLSLSLCLDSFSLCLL